MAKRDYSSAVNQSLRGRDPQPVLNDIAEIQTNENPITEVVNKKLTEASVIEKPILNPPTEIVVEEKISEIITKEPSKKEKTTTSLISEGPAKKKTFCISAWVPVEYAETFNSAAVVNKNASKYVSNLIIKDLEENGEKYKELASQLLNFWNN